jgi:hypothetical protein
MAFEEGGGDDALRDEELIRPKDDESSVGEREREENDRRDSQAEFAQNS